MQEKISSGDMEYLSLLQVIASFAVVTIHVNTSYFAYNETEGYWPSAVVIHFIVYFGVTVFFMITGVTLFDFFERYDLGTYWKKRFIKTLIPYIFWSMAAVVYRVFVSHSLSAADITPAFLIDGLVNGKLFSLYWFFIPLFSIYLSIPLFAAVEKALRKQVFSYLAIAGFLINCVWGFGMTIGVVDFSLGIKVPVVAAYLLPVVIGYLLHNYEMKKGMAVFCEAAAIAALVYMICGTITASRAAGKLVNLYNGYWHMLPVVYSTGVFLFFRRSGKAIMAFRPVGTIVHALRPYTFSVYLLHAFGVRIAEKVWHMMGRSVNQISYRVLIPPVVYLGSCAMIWCIRKLPLGKEVLP